MDVKQLTSFITDRVDPAKLTDAKALLSDFLGEDNKLDVGDITRFLSKLGGLLKPGKADEVKEAVTKFAGENAAGGLNLGDIAGKIFGK
ncbi:hypothetical protein LJC61_04365 [Ruminococcaceae bacterium OttesenSCG-928-A16]|nr:hypothetical protein [Ruminococcaceae bacterium OttesenSCG-928-A16]